MRWRKSRRYLTAVSSAVLLALCSSAALAADAVPDDSEGRTFCEEIGCIDGARICGWVTVRFTVIHWILGVVPFGVETPLSWLCYERSDQ